MNMRDLFAGMLPQPMRTKVAYDLQRIGVQGRPQYPDTDIARLQERYTRNEIVYAAINAKATAAVGPRLLVQRRRRDGEWAEVEGHPFRRLIMRPNPDMDEAAFTKAALVSRDTAGVFYAEKVRAGPATTGLPSQLWPLDPAKVFPVPGARGIAEYEFREGGKRVRIPANNMLVWRNPHVTSKYQGLSPLAVCLGTAEADSAQTDFVREFFTNGGVPGGILKIKGRVVSQQEANDLKQRWRERFAPRWGGTRHDIAVLDENAEYQKIGANIDELDSETLREYTETRVCMVFGTPPLIIYATAGMRRATYSNLKEAWAGFWDGTLTPLFRDYRSFLLWSLLVDFESEELILGERVRLAHDMTDVPALQEDVDALQNRARENFKAGGITLNEFRAAVGEQPDRQGDYYVRPATLVAVPIDQAVIIDVQPLAAALPAPEDEDDAAKARVSKQYTVAEE